MSGGRGEDRADEDARAVEADEDDRVEEADGVDEAGADESVSFDADSIEATGDGETSSSSGDGVESPDPALGSDEADGSAGPDAGPPTSGRVGPRREDPLATLADEVRDRRDADVDAGDPFDREEIETIDGDALWNRIDGENEFDAGGTTDREIRTVSKRRYCRGCEHFSEPPAVECENRGTEILEMPSLDTVRVADCPVVLEEERLERGE